MSCISKPSPRGFNLLISQLMRQRATGRGSTSIWTIDKQPSLLQMFTGYFCVLFRYVRAQTVEADRLSHPWREKPSSNTKFHLDSHANQCSSERTIAREHSQRSEQASVSCGPVSSADVGALRSSRRLGGDLTHDQAWYEHAMHKKNYDARTRDASVARCGALDSFKRF